MADVGKYSPKLSDSHRAVLNGRPFVVKVDIPTDCFPYVHLKKGQEPRVYGASTTYASPVMGMGGVAFSLRDQAESIAKFVAFASQARSVGAQGGEIVVVCDNEEHRELAKTLEQRK